ncbi:MAG: hypothetical protein EA361_06595 [Bacteroidetes bacterium]|nr:MAG: hypothetical protein EA361_06595 [Bacteroidota bacterium]
MYSKNAVNRIGIIIIKTCFMKLLKNSFPFLALLSILIITPVSEVRAQTLPEVLEEGTLSEQYEYLHERTNIYNNFRAIREDMFRKIRRNSIDSLNSAYAEIRQLNQQIAKQQSGIDSLNALQETTASERDTAIRDRDSLFLLGIPMTKTFYNVLLWSIIIGLAIVLLVIVVLFKRAHLIAGQKTREMKELQDEFDEYRKTSRERFEQQSIDHFNEVKRLRGI